MADVDHSACASPDTAKSVDVEQQRHSIHPADRDSGVTHHIGEAGEQGYIRGVRIPVNGGIPAQNVHRHIEIGV